MIKEVTYYQAQCDVCGTVDDGGEFSAWSDPDDARAIVVDNLWQEIEVSVPTTTPRGPSIYIRHPLGQDPFLERSVLVCDAHGGPGVLYCATCDDDLDAALWSIDVHGTEIMQACENGHPNVITLRGTDRTDGSQK